MWSSSDLREFTYAEGPLNQNCQQGLLPPKILDFIKSYNSNCPRPHDTCPSLAMAHAMLVPHWLQPIPTQHLPFIGHVCFRVCFDFTYGWMYLSSTSARFITGQGNMTLYQEQLRYNMSNTCTVKHFVIGCKTFTRVIKWLFNVNNMKDLFENINMDEILSFLRGTKWYQKILM